VAPLLPAVNSRLFFASDDAIHGGLNVQPISPTRGKLSLEQSKMEALSKKALKTASSPNSRISPGDKANARSAEG
jgi:hypothetical protein